jgi:hypothetical protein
LKIVGKWRARVIWPVFVLAWSALLAVSALAANLPIGQDIYIRASDANLYMRASTFFQDNKPTSLGTCSRGDDPENCRWILEPSKQRPGSYYIRSSDEGLYLHTHGGSVQGYQNRLHTCSRSYNYGNCQWLIEARAPSFSAGLVPPFAPPAPTARGSANQ